MIKGKLTYLAYEAELVPGVSYFKPIVDNRCEEMPIEHLELLIRDYSEAEQFEKCAEIQKVIDRKK